MLGLGVSYHGQLVSHSHSVPRIENSCWGGNSSDKKSKKTLAEIEEQKSQVFE